MTARGLTTVLLAEEAEGRWEGLREVLGLLAAREGEKGRGGDALEQMPMCVCLHRLMVVVVVGG